MNVCIIPARSGSKRIPKKNIKEFLGRPIILYSIDAAIESNCFDRVIVSTDSEEIACLAKNSGAQIPFIRPAEISDDYSSTLSVIKHALEQEELKNSIETVCCLYATAPFINAETLCESYEAFTKSRANYCLGVTDFAFPIQRAIIISNENRLVMRERCNSKKRSQDLEKTYHDAGQFCWGRASAFKDELPIYSGSTIPYFLPRHTVQDIDTMEDWLLAEAMYKLL